jgi:cytochrome c oxidase assembly protein subunit 15
VTQGIIGWYMVKSGLVNDVTVSHYRLSLHLSTALIIISSIFWLIINIKNNTHKGFFYLAKKNIIFQILFFLILLQVILGAFVSGLDAGKIYQTWPLMGQSFIPNDLILKNFNNFFDFTSHSLVQFYHRNLAYLITIYIFILGIYIYKKKIKKIYYSFSLMIFFLIIQVILGVLTLLSGLNIYLASAHQIGSVLLILGSINLYYSYIK